ncbi:MAG: NmrA family NAD(P)-binding protein, partial [Candidatus Kapabacteria bacterium]|nr:NmrA family NAD(P)-binding protein [Candidatus Kapabacteria bacterium]
MHKQRIALAGGSGYIGSRLIRILLERNTMVRTLVRSGSEHKIPVGAEILTGDVFS